MKKEQMLQNLHTHSVFCDGADTPREMAERALELGLSSLGFSGHGTTVLHDDCELGDRIFAYMKEVESLKSEYEGRLEIFLGCELDYYSMGAMPEGIEFDYTIASVHYALQDDGYISFDFNPEYTKDVINSFYGGSAEAYIRDYYEKIPKLHERVGGNILGHFDIPTKYIEKCPELFDTGADYYKKYSLDALHAARRDYDFFEVNMGVMARVGRSYPYPSSDILKEMKELKCKLLITSDCHNRANLATGYDRTVDYIKAHGFDEIYILTGEDFKGVKI